MQDDKFEYSLKLAPFRPQHRNTYKYEVRVSTVAVFPFIQMKLCSICSTEVQIYTCLNLNCLCITIYDMLPMYLLSAQNRKKSTIFLEKYTSLAELLDRQSIPSPSSHVKHLSQWTRVWWLRSALLNANLVASYHCKWTDHWIWGSYWREFAWSRKQRWTSPYTKISCKPACLD